MRPILKASVYIVPAIVVIGAAYTLLTPTSKSKSKNSTLAENKKNSEETVSTHSTKGDEEEDTDSGGHRTQGKKSALHASHEQDEDESEAEKKTRVSIRNLKVDLTLKSDDGVCLPAEYPGPGRTANYTIRLSSEEWKGVMDSFHDAKKDLVQWVKSYENEIGKEAAAQYSEKIKAVKIHRPPQDNEPDLDWRGLGVFSSGLIKVGGGFPDLIKKDPMRAKFELSRLIAQSLTACGSGIAEKSSAFSKTIQCLGYDEKSFCAQNQLNDQQFKGGEIADASWALSSAIASWASPPGCKLPAQKEQDLGRCLDKPSFQAIAQAGAEIKNGEINKAEAVITPVKNPERRTASTGEEKSPSIESENKAPKKHDAKHEESRGPEL